MALESWGGLRLGLMALGYQQVIWTHLHCVKHGVFKVAIAEELEEYPCPTCQQACKVAIVAQGFTKHGLPPPERLSKPLSARTRHELLVPERPPKRPQRIPDVHHGGKIRRGLLEHQSVCDSRPRANIVRSWAMPD
jgi:hypothetical protein